MHRKPNLLLNEFLEKSLDMPEIDWETVPPDVNPADAWDMYDDTVEGWVPVWFPTFDSEDGRSYGEFERANFKSHESMAPVGVAKPKKACGCHCPAPVVLRNHGTLSKGLN